MNSMKGLFPESPFGDPQMNNGFPEVPSMRHLIQMQNPPLQSFGAPPQIHAASLSIGGYYIVERKSDKLVAIFHISDQENPISDWWISIAAPCDVFMKSGYYLVANHLNSKAIFHKADPTTPVSDWQFEINSPGIISGESEHYLVTRPNNTQAIYHIDKPEAPVSGWHDSIRCAALLETTICKYYSVTILDENQSPWNGETVIYSLMDADKPLSKPWGGIMLSGLENGISDYYIVKDTKSGKGEAIFHIDNPEEPVSRWHNNISADGLFKDKESTRYMVLNSEHEQALFDISYPDTPISPWVKPINPRFNNFIPNYPHSMQI